MEVSRENSRQSTQSVSLIWRIEPIRRISEIRELSVTDCVDFHHSRISTSAGPGSRLEGKPLRWKELPDLRRRRLALGAPQVCFARQEIAKRVVIHVADVHGGPGHLHRRIGVAAILQ